MTDRLIQFYLTFECPICHQLFDVSILSIEVFYDGLEIACPKCGATITIHLTGEG